MKKTLIAPVVTAVVILGLSACTPSDSEPASSPTSSEADQKRLPDANTGDIDKVTGADKGAQSLMREWVTYNLDRSWESKRATEEMSQTIGVRDAEGEPTDFNASTLEVTYENIPETEFIERVTSMLEGSGYDTDRIECSGVIDESDEKMTRVCGVSFGEAELVDNDFFSVDIQWTSHDTKPGTKVMVTLTDDPTR